MIHHTRAQVKAYRTKSENFTGFAFEELSQWAPNAPLEYLVEFRGLTHNATSLDGDQRQDEETYCWALPSYRTLAVSNRHWQVARY